MRRSGSLFLLLLLVLWPGLGGAQVLVLVPGYPGDAGGFRSAGVTAVLSASGFVDAGAVAARPQGPQFGRAAGVGARPFYTVHLAGTQPLVLQAQALNRVLQALTQRHPGQELVLVGHSSGGVVARLALVTGPGVPVSTLITIASPHAGSGWAEMARSVAEALRASPLGWYAPFFGLDDWHRDDGWLADLGEARPGTLLGWLNTRSHPPLRYVSVVRLADPWVAPASQDMGRLAPLAGRSEALISPAGHALTAADGTVIAALLSRPREARRD
ncbi:MAG: lipase family alpha/beta hydrolase [Pseudomonadota bacterium]